MDFKNKYMTPHFETEKMNEVFTKYHIKGLPFDAVIHNFTEKDKNEHIHDHPFGFTTHILKGSYVERIYNRWSDGSYTTEIIERKEGTSHFVPANLIHEIIDIDKDGCFTIIRPNVWEKHVYFYKFENGVAYKRRWDETEFEEIGL